MNIKDNPDLQQKLAAEYALGTLKGHARHRFEALLREDAALRATVAEWQEKLVPLMEFAPPAAPPERVWHGIAAGVRPRRGAAGSTWVMRLWQTVAGAAVAASVVLAVLLVQRGQEVSYDRMASLTDEKSNIALVVAGDSRHQAMDVRVVEGVTVPDDRTLQLWAISKAGQPRSLGILADNRHARLALDARAAGADVALLAISLEPKGGSPNPNAPTGPVLWKGNWVTL
ncbi:hypothetical protein E4L96_17250 [Massilia arenosa]|uniref:Anti-sigma K factor RskA C-terminal domain-containing protein n=1 Tax=Zemynaea arenosa TaxID=2561931 RepID=A0A4Y9S7N7_9BURK|nr:anti-sigma factor [Massilia arenosa]TFW16060.1 hypothetical protein E4L96_17250 [Massilia arenosa]